MDLIERIGQPSKKKLLSIDGGGIRGVLALGVLKKIEDILKAESRQLSFRLADYFDYISGTSTGAIVATALSIGMAVDDILKFYREAGAQMFVKANLLRRLRYKFEDEPLADKLREVFGADTVFGSPKVRTLLMMVMRNATTDSPWPLSNNPYAKYNANKDRLDDNLNVDGGVTMYNNPAFQMFLMATLDRYWPKAPDKRWKSGVDELLIVSVGTGTAPNVRSGLDPDDMNLLYNATTIPSALMFAAQNEQDMLCRVFGKCVAGDSIDREIGNLQGCVGPLEAGGKLFTYARYDAELSREGLDQLGCPQIEPKTVQKLDSVDGIEDLWRVGSKVGDKVKPEHFAGFPAI